jgi:hypothetical protein
MAVFGKSKHHIWRSFSQKFRINHKKAKLQITLVSANVAQEQGQREHFLPFAPGGLWVNGQ